MATAQHYLTDHEIKHFIDDLDVNKDGKINYWELEKKLDQVHQEIAPKAEPHHLHHSSQPDEARHEFLRSLLGTREDHISKEQFEQSVRTWEIPSLEQDRKEAKEEDDYLKRMSIWRRVRAFWAVNGHKIVFMSLVVVMMVAFGIWQLVKYLTYDNYRPAFGWGVVVSKTAAGVLYPTFFFIILSMSRWFATYMRRFYLVSKVINWDLSQSFHIEMSIIGLLLATIHAIGHLSGSFVFGSKESRQDKLAVVLGLDAVPRSYMDFVRSLPGWTGLAALGCFYLLALLSAPPVRKWSYELFQLGHLLMFPMIGLLIAHGTAGLLQWPMFGYWLAFPTLLVICERIWRLIVGFRDFDATLELLDEETVAVTAEIPKTRFWNYKAGQYVLLQVPKISLFQWHPFTVSTCMENRMQVHIKADGDWTSALRDLAKRGQCVPITIGLDGPFGAPAQRFYNYEYSMVFGAGIGVTPFSGILTDLQYHELERVRSHNSPEADVQGRERKFSVSPYSDHRRIDFHWMVRDKNNLLWFSDLLNEVTRAQKDRSHLDIRIQTYVTQKRKEVSTHVFRWLLEKHRTESQPNSPLTGLLNPTHFGRPDLGTIMESHYSDMCKAFAERMHEKDGASSGMGDEEEIKVGVFFCGPPVIGEQLADRCAALTARARSEKRKIKYQFMIEVFG